ncbi:MAG: hypothetical protein R2753_17160 [Chitinophagales bacterium]
MDFNPAGFNSTSPVINVSPSVTTVYTVTSPGCVSSLTESVTVTISDAVSLTVNATDCDPGNVGTVVQNLQTYQGCDSIVTTVTKACYQVTVTLSMQRIAIQGMLEQWFKIYRLTKDVIL